MRLHRTSLLAPLCAALSCGGSAPSPEPPCPGSLARDPSGYCRGARDARRIEDGGFLPEPGDTEFPFLDGEDRDGWYRARDTGASEQDESSDELSQPGDTTPELGDVESDVTSAGGDADTSGWQPECIRPGVVRISEVLADPDGADEGREFIELIGAPLTPLSRTRLLLVDGATGRVIDDVPLTGQLDGNGIFVAGGAAVPEARVNLGHGIQNGPDAVVLLGCDSSVIDAVAWGRFEVAPPAGEGRPAPIAGSGRSLSRCADGSDTGDNAADLHAAAPTPGAVNAGFTDPLACFVCPAETPPEFVINEILVDPEGADEGFEFVELHGPAGAPLSGLLLANGNGTGGEPWAPPLPLDGVSDGSGFFLVGSAGADQSLPWTLQNGPDSLFLLWCDGSRVDAVGWGDFDAADVFLGEGTPAPRSTSGGSLGRVPDARDTDDNGADFVVLREPTPRAANPSR